MSRIYLLIACTLLCAAAFGQTEKRLGALTTALAQAEQHEHGLTEVRQIIGSEDGDIRFFSMEMGSMRDTVQGAPYTATAVTESTQVLADGNRIVNKRSSFIARDGQGRVRREETFGPGGSESKKMVLITDPSSKTDYVINPDEQMARIVKRKEGAANIVILSQQKRAEIEKRTETETKGVAIERRHEREGERKREILPPQVIEGLSCEGERITRTIPAGAIGNEKPIEIVSETWTSPELHVMVMRKRSDPRMGETVYRLTDIKRGEPDPALFQVPSNYKSTIRVEPPPSRD